MKIKPEIFGVVKDNSPAQLCKRVKKNPTQFARSGERINKMSAETVV